MFVETPSSVYTFLPNASAGGLWLAHEKLLQIPPKGIYGQTLGEHQENPELDHLNEILQSLPLQKSHSPQNNPLSHPGVYKHPTNKNHLPSNPLQTTQGNIHTPTGEMTEIPENEVMPLQILPPSK